MDKICGFEVCKDMKFVLNKKNYLTLLLFNLFDLVEFDIEVVQLIFELFKLDILANCCKKNNKNA